MPDEKELEKKICKICEQSKSITEYNKAGGGKWLQPYCKSCDTDRKRQYRKNNYDKVSKRRKEYYQENKDSIIEKQKKRDKLNAESNKKYRKGYYIKNKEIKLQKDKEYKKINGKKIAEKQRLKRHANIDFYKEKARERRRVMTPEEKQKMAQYQKEYRRKNKDKYKQYREQNKNRIRERRRDNCRKRNAEDIQFRIVKNLRTRIRFALKRDGAIKSDTTEKLLGCSIAYFVEYFKALFVEDMTWDKFMNGEIQIDHKKPCAKFDLTKEDQQRECFSYKNLQPLWEEDNLKKGAKIL